MQERPYQAYPKTPNPKTSKAHSLDRLDRSTPKGCEYVRDPNLEYPETACQSLNPNAARFSNTTSLVSSNGFVSQNRPSTMLALASSLICYPQVLFHYVY